MSDNVMVVSVPITEQKIIEYMESFGIASQLDPKQKKQFIEVATAYNLNPFKREVYCVPYGGKLSIIVGYEVYLKRASRCNDMNGWSVSITDDLKKATVTIHRKSWGQPFVHDVLMAEYKQNNRMWSEKPATMLKKVAICQAFRMAFPDELGGMPYTADELPDKMTTVASEPVVAIGNIAPPKAKEAPMSAPVAPIVDAVVVEPTAKETPAEVNDGPIEGTLKEATITSVLVDARKKLKYKIKTSIGDYLTDKEVLATVAKMNIGKSVNINYTVDNDMETVLIDVIPLS